MELGADRDLSDSPKGVSLVHFRLRWCELRAVRGRQQVHVKRVTISPSPTMEAE
jgi:hypothetical protein